MTPEKLSEVRQRLEAFKHWKVVAKQEWEEGPGPDLEALLVYIDALQAEVAALKRAKTENDDRFMIERNEARLESAAKEREETNRRVTTELVGLVDENARLRETLEWYAALTITNRPGCGVVRTTIDPLGDRARKALELMPVQTVLEKFPKDMQTFVEALKTTPLKNSDNT